MNPQVHKGERPVPERMSNGLLRIRDEFLNKPSPCLWTSTYTPDEPFDCGWDEWCYREEFGDPDQPRWLLTVSPSARILELDTAEDFAHIFDRYGLSRYDDRFHFLDWTPIASVYDGFHLTKRAAREFHWDAPLGYPSPFTSWDCESTAWFRWCFDDVQTLPLRRLPNGIVPTHKEVAA